MAFKTGKLAPKFHPHTLDFAKYLLADAPPSPPEKTYWEYKIPPDTIGMYGNDLVGDCTCAEVAHHLMLITAHTGKIVIPDPADVIHMYSEVSGYDPKTGNNDNGAAITDVLEYWRTIGLAGHKIDAWFSVNHRNLMLRHQAVWLFQGLSVGVQLPSSAGPQFDKHQNWELVNNEEGEDGHCILESGYGAEGHNFETWGRGDQKASNAWDAAYTDESYFVITPDLIDAATGLSPTSLKIDALLADAKFITSS